MLALATVAAGIAVALVALGRWERERWIDGQLRGMERTMALVGPLQQRSLSGYRRQPGFDCLVYRRGANVFALELCVDPGGRLVETIDRRRSTRRISSLLAEPGAASIRLDRGRIDRLLRAMGAPTEPG